MNTSLLSSSFHGAKPIQLPHCRSSPRHGKIHIISCRATTNSNVEKRTNFYQVLSLRSEDASFDDIKKAYRRMALVYHPDVCPPSRKEEFTHIFVQLHTAYETLSDPVLRKKHDRELGLKGVENERERWEQFARATWENQLCGLKIRSDYRMRRKEGMSWR